MQNLGIEAESWASRIEFGPQGWSLGLGTGILALRLDFGPRDWDLRGRDREDGGGGGEGENPPYV